MISENFYSTAWPRREGTSLAQYAENGAKAFDSSVIQNAFCCKTTPLHRPSKILYYPSGSLNELYEELHNRRERIQVSQVVSYICRRWERHFAVWLWSHSLHKNTTHNGQGITDSIKTSARTIRRQDGAEIMQGGANKRETQGGVVALPLLSLLPLLALEPDRNTPTRRETQEHPHKKKCTREDKSAGKRFVCKVYKPLQLSVSLTIVPVIFASEFWRGIATWTP